MNTLASRRGIAMVIIAGILTAVPLLAQTNKEIARRDRQIDNLIRSIDDIIWSNIVIYQLQGDFKNDLLKNMQADDSTDMNELTKIGDVIAPEPLSNFSTNAVAVARRARTTEQFKQQICSRYSQFECEYDFDPDLFDKAFSTAKSIVSRENSRPKDFYLVTSRDRDNPRLIALLGVNLESGQPALMPFRKVGSQLYDFLSANNSGSMYQEMKDELSVPGSTNLKNQMFVLRDLSTVQIEDRTVALATYIDEDQFSWVLRSISMERPIREAYTPPPAPDTSTAVDDGGFGGFGLDTDLFGDMKPASATVVEGAEVPGAVEHPQELVVGTDVVAGYYSYQMNDDKRVDDTKWGVELLNRFDEINYPSIWGGRLTLNAILKNVKIGAVLPTPRFGGSTLGESGLFGQPQRILGGYGAAFSGDFAFPVLQNSGLFNFYASYTFGESETDQLGLFVYPNASDSSLGNASQTGSQAYLVRYAFQGYYSFGFHVDPDAKHLFRLKLGGTVYGMDNMERRQVIRPGDANADTVPVLAKNFSTTRGGIAGKIEYMKGGTDIPYGASLQYFDGSILSNLWLQFILARNWDLKIQGKYFTPLFRDPRPWESRNLVIPSLEVMYHFGTP